MADEEKASRRRTPEKEEKEAAPHTRVRSGGKVSQRLRILADLYLATSGNAGKSVRWVYSPLHKPELSNVINRQIDGFALIYVKELGEDTVALLPGTDAEEPVRVGDVIMMAIDEAVRQGLQDDNAKSAEEERTRVEEEFYASVDEIQLASGMRKEYRARPRGTSITEIVERDVDVPEAHKES